MTTIARSTLALRAIPLFFIALLASSSVAALEPYTVWKRENDAVFSPLNGLLGVAARGKRLVVARDKGNCLACHLMPIAEEPFHGTLGPPLIGIGTRLAEGQIRLRIIDEKLLNPGTIMPGYYRHPNEFRRIADDNYQQTILTAQEVEDIVAYLLSLK